MNERVELGEVGAWRGRGRAGKRLGRSRIVGVVRLRYRACDYAHPYEDQVSVKFEKIEM